MWKCLWVVIKEIIHNLEGLSYVPFYLEQFFFYHKFSGRENKHFGELSGIGILIKSEPKMCSRGAKLYREPPKSFKTGVSILKGN